MSVPAAIANAVADAIGREDVELPFTPGRVWELLPVKPVSFRYERPESVEEAVSLLAEHGDDAKVLAGGQSLVPALNMRLVRPAVLVDINRVLSLDNVAPTGDLLRLGATVRQADGRVLEHPLLAEALPHVGHFATRNRGTVAGSSLTPIPLPSCRSVSPCSVARSEPSLYAARGRSPPPTSS